MAVTGNSGVAGEERVVHGVSAPSEYQLRLDVQLACVLYCYIILYYVGPLTHYTLSFIF